MTVHYDERQLDALRELASIGSGTAATALAKLLGRPVELTVPRATVLSLADAIDAAGPPDATVASVVLPVVGEVEAVVLLLFSDDCAATLCGLLGVDPHSALGESALGEAGNILGAAAVGALATMTGLALEPRPPQVLNDMLGAIVATALTATAGEHDVALVLDGTLRVEGVACGLSFLALPTAGGVAEVLGCLGLDHGGEE